MATFSLFNTTQKLLDPFIIDYLNDPARMFIADSIAPRVPSDIDSQYYITYGKGKLQLTPGGGLRARNTEPERLPNPTYSTTKFQIVEHSWDLYLDDEDRDSSQPEFRIDQQYTANVTAQAMLRHEYDVASTLFNATTFSGYTSALNGSSGSYQWDNANADPRVQIDIAKQSIRKNGVVNSQDVELWVNDQVYNTLSNTMQTLVNKYTVAHFIEPEELAGILGLKAIHIGSGVYQDSTGAFHDIWGNYALFGFTKPASDIADVSFAKTFVQTNKDIRVTAFDWRISKSTIYRVEYNYVVVATAPSSGYLFSSVLGTYSA